ncbi:YqeG family HAD IIIA-type phosphatase [Paenibacillus sp. YN15]|uniref:YqeG family HAD IIIA-type phosphatase n=1 Tax=Paenibacillus sp. YN15 TaxID=1742774 RepID=UPI000DCE6D26|nr:YqeG family HAD IIIA-type phosphatase [Paenibacillus sp. YN15]RAV01684.1 YqeG family HAD IIIA-type phosphatase [Paenibacillus sp. YN15]
MFNKLKPRLAAHSIFEIPLDELWRQGIRGIITDLDNTLVGAKVPLATPELVDWLKKVQDRGFQLVIVSNNNKLRVSAFADPIVVPYISSAKKPMNASFIRAMKLMQLGPAQTAVVGDQMLTDVLGGNRLGLYTILVAPMAVADEGFFTKVNRAIERVVVRFMKQ